MITVANKKRDWLHTDHVYIGRPSPLSNPFVVGRDGDRNLVISAYENWLRDQLVMQPASSVAQAYRALVTRYWNGEDLQLICWCSPQACHGDVIKRFIEESQY